MLKDKQVSVIIIADNNLEKLMRCLYSLVEQTINSFEVLIVQNENPSIEKSIIETFEKEGLNIKFVNIELESNEISFILKGLHSANGDYLLFINSNDRISVDYCRALFNKAVNKKADLVVAPLGIEQPNGDILYYNLDYFRLCDVSLKKEEAFKEFVSTTGSFLGWYTIYNKLYSKELLYQCKSQIDEIASLNELYIGYDIAFSFCIWFNANHIVNSDNVFYYRNKERYDYGVKLPDNIASQHANSIKIAFDFVEQKLFKNMDVKKKYSKKLNKFRKTYIKKIYTEITNQHDEKYQFEIRTLFKKVLFLSEEELEINKSDILLEKHVTNLFPQYKHYEDIKRFISSSKCEYVLFDVFDTLIERPFFYPTDLFMLLDKPFNDLLNNKGAIDFAEIRKNGEQGCRTYYYAKRPHFEDVNIDEIYDYISEYYGIDITVTNEIKKKEIELELHYCSARGIGKELFNLAQESNKKIIIASDMYLNKCIINEMLTKNGYSNYVLFVSNDLGMSKYSGALYRHIVNTLKIKHPEYSCFIGDNYYSDVQQAEKHGFIPFHVPKATEIFCNQNQVFNTGDFFKKVYEPNGSIIDSSSSLAFYLGIRCMIAIAANSIYGTYPFTSHDKETDYNLDPRIIGTYSFGMFLLSLAKWILDDSKERNISTIHFVARDGYIVKQAYDIISKYAPNSPKSNYIYASRKALAPLVMDSAINMCECFNSAFILNQSPQKIISLFKSIIPPDKYNIAEKICIKNHFSYTKKFEHADSFYRFTRFFNNEFFDKDLSSKYSSIIKKYFEKEIHKGDAIFDIGYSGRTEFILSNLLGYPIDSYYVHAHEDSAFKRKLRGNFHNRCFYGYKPVSTFVVREHLFLPQQPSCIGFDPENSQPIFEEYNSDFVADFISKIIQDSAVTFIEKYMHFFGEILDSLHFRYYDAAIPFETFLHYPKQKDMLIFSMIDLEDDFGLGGVNLTHYWAEELNRYRINVQIPQEQIVHNQSADLPFQLATNAVPATSLNSEFIMSNDDLEELYRDGLFVALFRKTNKLLPKGSRRRNLFKRIAAIFIKS